MADYQSTDQILPNTQKTSSLNSTSWRALVAKCKILPTTQNSSSLKTTTWRALVAYWILGLCNNYGYVVMLTAAHDIISETSDDKIAPRNCTKLSTGVILLADIVPSLAIKLVAPFMPFCVHFRIGVCIALAALGYILVAISTSRMFSLMGVVATSFCSGLGEVTLLQYSSFYDKNVVSTWSSGTGGAGIIGSLSYTVLQVLGIRTTFLILLIVPVMMAISFWVILPSPNGPLNTDIEAEHRITTEEMSHPNLTLAKKFKLIPGLMKFMIPLAAVYLFEYFINQGTFDLVDFRGIWVDRAGQYRWLQVDYQIGVFLSRSSVNFFHIKHIWVLALLQLLNVVIFTTEVIFYYIPNFYIILVLVLWEGFLGGAAYVNTFYKISVEVKEEHRHFSLGTTSFSDTIGITFAGFLAMAAHNGICTLPMPERG